MFGGQNFHDFARSQGGAGGLDEILSQIFGGLGGFNSGFAGGFSRFSSSRFGGGFSENLDIQAKLSIPFDLSILGGEHTISLNGETIKLKIPAGISEGKSIRVRGKGHKGRSGQGDLLLKISVLPSEKYERDGDDLVCDFDVPLGVALFGGKVVIPTLYKEVTLKIPQNTKNAQKFRIKELGAKNIKSGQMGDLYLKANVVLPSVDSLSSELATRLKDELLDKTK